MRVLTVRQPWAWAIIHGGKDVENRVRNLAGDYRGPVAIHAGVRQDDGASGIALRAARGNWYLNRDSGHDDVEPWKRDHGHIIGVVDLVDVHAPCKAWEDDETARCSEWAESDVFHLVLAAPRALATPIPFKGALGLRTLPDDVEAAIREQVR